LPELAGGIDEGLPLGGEVAVTCWNAEDEAVLGGKDVWGDDWVV